MPDTRGYLCPFVQRWDADSAEQLGIEPFHALFNAGFSPMNFKPRAQFRQKNIVRPSNAHWESTQLVSFGSCDLRLRLLWKWATSAEVVCVSRKQLKIAPRLCRDNILKAETLHVKSSWDIFLIYCPKKSTLQNQGENKDSLSALSDRFGT